MRYSSGQIDHGVGFEQERSLQTRQSLLSRLRRDGDDTSWKEFFDTYWGLIYKAAVRAGLSATDAQDVVQETILTVSRGMSEFRYDPGRGSFKGWLLTTTRWRVLDHLRRARKLACLEPLPDPTRETSLAERLPGLVGEDLDRMWEEDWHRNLLAIAMERVKSRVDPKQFQVFELAALKGWAPAKIARTFGMNRPYVNLIKHRVSRLVREEVKRLESQGI